MGAVIEAYWDSKGTPITLSTPIDRLPSGDGGGVTLGDRLRAIEGKIDVALSSKADKSECAEIRARLDNVERNGSWHVPGMLQTIATNNHRIEELEKSSVSEDALKKQRNVMIGFGIGILGIFGTVIWQLFTLRLHP